MMPSNLEPRIIQQLNHSTLIAQKSVCWFAVEIGNWLILTRRLNHANRFTVVNKFFRMRELPVWSGWIFEPILQRPDGSMLLQGWGRWFEMRSVLSAALRIQQWRMSKFVESILVSMFSSAHPTSSSSDLLYHCTTEVVPLLTLLRPQSFQNRWKWSVAPHMSSPARNRPLPSRT